MKATVTTNPAAPQVSASDVARSISRCTAICLVYILQTIAKALDVTQRVAMSMLHWLNSRHNFADEKEPVIMTGWQYLGFGVLVMFVAMVMCIEW